MRASLRWNSRGPQAENISMGALTQFQCKLSFENPMWSQPSMTSCVTLAIRMKRDGCVRVVHKPGRRRADAVPEACTAVS